MPISPHRRRVTPERDAFRPYLGGGGEGGVTIQQVTGAAGDGLTKAGDTFDVGEGPGIDVTADAVGVGGDTILLYDSGGDPVAEYAATDAGLTSALSAASSGDTVLLPPQDISGGPWTIPSGVSVVGQGRTAIELTGNLTVNGQLEAVSVDGDVDADGGNIINCYLEGSHTIQGRGHIKYCDIRAVSGGNGVTFSGTGGHLIYSIVGLYGCTWGIYVGTLTQASKIVGCEVVKYDATYDTEKAIYVNDDELTIHNCSFRAPKLCAEMDDVLSVSNTFFYSETEDALQNDGAGNLFVNCTFYTDGGAGKYGVVTNASPTLYGCGFDSIDDITSITFGRGSYGNYGEEAYHAYDIEQAALQRHLPQPGADGNYARSDGTDWQQQSGIPASDITGTITDDDAIHDNVASEIHSISEKASPVDADEIVIEDSADSYNKKRVQLGNLSGSSGAADDSYWEPAVTADDPTNPEILFTSDGDIAMTWVS